MTYSLVQNQYLLENDPYLPALGLNRLKGKLKMGLVGRHSGLVVQLISNGNANSLDIIRLFDELPCA